MREDTNHNKETPSTQFHLASGTHIGLHRSENQDAFAVRRTPDGGTLLVVADGMGGHKGGADASRIAVDVFLKEAEQAQEISPDRMEHGIHEANRIVFNEAEQDSSLKGMGTTLVASYLKEGKGIVINLGDSRGYLFGNGELREITRDHRLVAEMVARGELTPEEAEYHPKRNVLSQAIGMKEPPKPDLFNLSFLPGDILLLCTDGLHGMIDDSEIKRILATGWSLQAKCDSLIEAALDGGGRDNVTLILAEAVTEDGLSSGPATDPGERGKQASRKKGDRIIKGGVILLGAVLIGGGVWGGYELDLFTNEVSTADTLAIDSTWQEIDTNTLQVTPGEQINDRGTNDTLPKLNLE